MIKNNTICAVSTAPGIGGIAVIRVSGDNAIQITDSLFLPVNDGKKLSERKSYTLAYGQFINTSSEIIDDVMISIFRNPHSFTGEDTTEISCHGSSYIQQQILQSLVNSGCRVATAGEFTQRAFLNGKLDLSQAEAVADLIASDSAATHRLAMNQMKGAFSDELMQLRLELLNLTSLIELELDFSEEEVEFADRQQLRDLADRIEDIISGLAHSFSVGNAIKNGIPVAIVGETNAGKSTLLNAMLGEERAIVSDIRGTTRDVIEDTINISGLTFRFIDTAGIRDTIDKIESLGIELAFRKMKQASIVLWMVDATESISSLKGSISKILKNLKDQKVIVVFNKSELISSDQLKLTISEFMKIIEEIIISDSENKGTDISKVDSLNIETIAISAKKNIGVQELRQQLVKAASIPQIGSNDVIVTNIRHYEALKNALNAIQRVKDGLNSNISGDFISQDIRECIHFLGEITGQITNDEVLGSIFGRFCIGK